MLATVLGVLAALVSIASFLPQIAKILREKDASTVSYAMYQLTVMGFCLWIAYGISLHNWPLIVSNVASLCLSAIVLCLKRRFSRSD